MIIKSSEHNKEEYVKFGKATNYHGIIHIDMDCPQHKYLEFGEGSCGDDFCIWVSDCDDGSCETFFNEYCISGLEYGSDYVLLVTPQKWEYVITLVPLFECIFNEENEEIKIEKQNYPKHGEK